VPGSYPKLHKILAKHGYKYENKRIVKNDPDSAADGTTAATPVKKSGGKKKGTEGTEVGSDGATPGKTPKKTKVNSTPASKKRKLEDTERTEDDEEVTNGDEVANGDGAIEAKEDGEKAEDK
jgi:hypothetical protein